MIQMGLKSNAASGAPGGIRTPNLLIRSQALYPVELRAQFGTHAFTIRSPDQATVNQTGDLPSDFTFARPRKNQGIRY